MQDSETSDNIGLLEIYSVDISPDKSKILFGGQDNTFSIINTYTNDLIFQSTDLKESIFLSKFYKSKIVIVLVNGSILIYNSEYNSEFEFPNEDTTTFANIFNDQLAVATESFEFIILNLQDFTIQEIFLPSFKLIDVQMQNNVYYILTECKLMFYSTDSQQLDYFYRPINLASALCVKESIIVFKETGLLVFIRNFNVFLEIAFDFEVESIVCLKNYVLIGGSFSFLFIYDLNYHLERRITLQCEGITKIKVRNNLIYFSTFDSLFGCGSFDKIEYLGTEVDTVFDFEVAEDFFVLGGVNGVSIQKIGQ